MVIEQDPLRNVCSVVINDEEQHSILPLSSRLPADWKSVGMQDSKENCLAGIKKLRTDMRPLPLREQMDFARTRILSQINATQN